VPTVVVATDEFLPLGRMESTARGLPELPFVVTAHPLGGLRPPLVAEKAAALVEATARAVTADGHGA
jgi:hypothetical protein